MRNKEVSKKIYVMNRKIVLYIAQISFAETIKFQSRDFDQILTSQIGH